MTNWKPFVVLLFPLCTGTKGIWRSSQSCWHRSSGTSHGLLCSGWNVPAHVRQKKSEKWREMCGTSLKGCEVLHNMEIKNSLRMGCLRFEGSHWKLCIYFLDAVFAINYTLGNSLFIHFLPLHFTCKLIKATWLKTLEFKEEVKNKRLSETQNFISECSILTTICIAVRQLNKHLRDKVRVDV